MSIQKNSGSGSARKLVESAIMVAIATVLSLIRLVSLPYGGFITIACSLPIIIIAYRHGLRWGLLTGLVFGIIQQLLGLNTLTFVTSWQSVIAVMLLDYLIAFMVIGFGGVFRSLTSQSKALLFGAILTGVLRYLCHVISGATVWAGLSIPTNAALLYSIGYNATYMIPETIVTAAVAYYIGTVLDFRGTTVTFLKKTDAASTRKVRWIAGLPLAIALIFDTVMVFSRLQNSETGSFDITGLSEVNWILVVIVSVIAVVLTVILSRIPERKAHE